MNDKFRVCLWNSGAQEGLWVYKSRGGSGPSASVAQVEEASGQWAVRKGVMPQSLSKSLFKGEGEVGW